MILDPWFYFVAIPAVLIAGISKGGFGGGLVIIAVPMLSLAIAPPKAAGIMLPILCVMDLYGCWAYRRTWDRKVLGVLIPAGLVGIGVGILSFKHLNEAMFTLLIGTLAILFVIYSALRDKDSVAPTRPLPTWVGLAAGALSGFTSFVAHAGGPPITAYLLSLRLNALAFVSSSVVFFALVNYVKLIPYAWLGQLNSGNMITSLALSPLAIAGVAAGVFLHHRISALWFNRAVHILLAVTGVKLIFDGILDL